MRDVERRIEQAGKKGELQGWRPTLAKPDMARPADGIPQDIAEHMRLMCDILVLAFRTDTTRICTLKLNNDHSSLRFPNLGVDYMIHHLLSHSDTADWLKVNRFFLEQVAYIARKLEAIDEGGRTALDNTMLLYLSSMLTGNHEANQLPVVLVGGGGRLDQGWAGARLQGKAGSANGAGSTSRSTTRWGCAPTGLATPSSHWPRFEPARRIPWESPRTQAIADRGSSRLRGLASVGLDRADKGVHVG